MKIPHHPQGGWVVRVVVITLTTKATHCVLGHSDTPYYYFILTTILRVKMLIVLFSFYSDSAN